MSAEDAAVHDYAASYEELVGFVPPRVRARLDQSGELDPRLLELQEQVRAYGMGTDCFEPKLVQLMLWGILLGQVGSGARWHGIAARRLGATWEELHAVAGLAYLFRGMPAMNLASELIADMRAADPAGQA